MDPESSEGSNFNTASVQENLSSASDQSSLLRTTEENEKSSDINPDPSTSTEEYSHIDKRLKTELSKKATSYAIAYPLIMLLIVFRSLINSIGPFTGIYKNLREISFSFKDLLEPHSELLYDTLNGNFDSLTFENVLDNLKQSKAYLKEVAPELFEQIDTLEKYETGSSSVASNSTEEESLIKGNRIRAQVFDKLIETYRFQLNNLIRLAKADNAETMASIKGNLRWLKDYMTDTLPEHLRVVYKKLKNFERKISIMKNEERITAIEEELHLMKEAEKAIDDYCKFRREILFCLSVSSLKDLEKKLQASAEKAKRLVPEFYDYATNEENFN